MHNHTQFSNISTGLDSINKLTDLIDYAKQLGMSGLAITNHDNLSEVVNINREQKRLRDNNENFTLAIGNEIYLVDNFDSEVKERQKYYHFILIAKDKIGYDALIELSSRAWYRSAVQYGRRRIPTLKKDIEEILEKAKGHLVSTSACLGGELATLVNQDKIEEAKQFVQWCQQRFGYDDFYIELQPSDSPEQINFNSKAIKELDSKFVIATDAHYQKEEDFPIFEAFLRSQQEKREVQEYYTYARMMSEEEIYSLMKLSGVGEEEVKKFLNNTVEVGKQIEFYDLSQKPTIPKVKIESIELKITDNQKKDLSLYPTLTWALEEDEQTKFCLYYCLNSLDERDLWNAEYLSRLEEEFDTFKFQSEEFKDNFFCYFNTMQHYLEMAWSIDCAVGPSRGSASGSLLCYLMDIVQCDPIKYDLYFWRFANKVRTSPLDIDSDLQPSKRAELFKKIREERGELGLTQVATYRTLTLKAAIGNAARGYRSKDFLNGLDPDISTYLSSLIEVRRGFVATLKQTLNGDETTGYSVNHQFIKECNAYPGLLEIIQKIEGVITGSSTHAAAVIFFDDNNPLQNYCSLMRAPNGDLCTALDLHTVEEVGCYKYDFLLLTTLDIQATCFKLLQKDGLVPQELTLKQCFRKYINPNTTDFSNPKIWDAFYKGKTLSVFQWDADSGRKGLLKTYPSSLDELSACNGLIRLMTQEDEEDQIERFVRIKEDPQSFEEEMIEAELNDDQRKIMHEELDKFNGCAVMQESFMTLSQKLAGYSLAEADALRKIVAKKKMNEITAQKEFFFNKIKESGGSEKTSNYLYRTIISPSLGYSFSKNHSSPYSIIGVQCILLSEILFPPIYWQMACLLQRSGALDNKSADYNKIAEAVSLLMSQGVNILSVDINKSEENFRLDAKTESIYYGFSALKGLRENVIEKILQERPFKNLKDFIDKTAADITSIVSLVKSGSFDFFESRMDTVKLLAALKSETKSKLNGQNLLMISRQDLWPKELSFSQRVFNFNHYLKSLPDSTDENYKLNELCLNFLEEIDFANDGEYLEKSSWSNYYNYQMRDIKAYLIDNQEEMLENLNSKIEHEWLEKYFPGDSIAQWEIETMGVCFAEHPFAKVENLSNFEDLLIEPQVKSIFHTKNGRSVPLFNLTMIAGIVIAKDKMHSSITLLTKTGPVKVKFRKQQFATYDSQISQVIDGKKKVIEKSWFNRGVGLIVHGMRQNDTFIAKTYKNSPMSHTAYRIIGLLEGNKFDIQKERKKGKQEETNDS